MTRECECNVIPIVLGTCKDTNEILSAIGAVSPEVVMVDRARDKFSFQFNRLLRTVRAITIPETTEVHIAGGIRNGIVRRRFDDRDYSEEYFRLIELFHDSVNTWLEKPCHIQSGPKGHGTTQLVLDTQQRRADIYEPDQQFPSWRQFDSNEIGAIREEYDPPSLGERALNWLIRKVAPHE